MKKISLLFVASAIAVGSAYACGGGDEPAKNPNDMGSASASATTTPSATAETPSATVSATASAPPPAPEPPPLAVDGVKIVGKTKDGKAIAIEVKPDGTVNGTKDGKSMLIATFVKNELKDDKGVTVFSVALDGKVTSPSLSGGTMQFNDKDELQVDGKTVITIGDDGTPSVTGSKTEKAPFKFDKLPPKSKRAAVLLTGMMLLQRAPTAGPATSASVAAPKPSASAAPKK
ncbi:hypothetical protein BH09MYX1_BH09MYX1_15690 [soil metagenome]